MPLFCFNDEFLHEVASTYGESYLSMHEDIPKCIDGYIYVSIFPEDVSYRSIQDGFLNYEYQFDEDEADDAIVTTCALATIR